MHAMVDSGIEVDQPQMLWHFLAPGRIPVLGQVDCGNFGVADFRNGTKRQVMGTAPRIVDALVIPLLVAPPRSCGLFVYPPSRSNTMARARSKLIWTSG